MRQLVCTMFLSNNCPSFHLWREENLVKHRKVSKYYETDCSVSIHYKISNYRGGFDGKNFWIYYLASLNKARSLYALYVRKNF